MQNHELGQSKEDYLEAIAVVRQRNGACRLTDVAEYLHFSKPSVSIALRKLEDEGYVRHEEWQVVLTEKGQEIADRTLEKHRFFRALFEAIGIPKERANEEACAVEHVISEESFRLMVRHWGDLAKEPARTEAEQSAG